MTRADADDEGEPPENRRYPRIVYLDDFFRWPVVVWRGFKQFWTWLAEPTEPSPPGPPCT
jgi:hypothetical protein